MASEQRLAEGIGHATIREKGIPSKENNTFDILLSMLMKCYLL